MHFFFVHSTSYSSFAFHSFLLAKDEKHLQIGLFYFTIRYPRQARLWLFATISFFTYLGFN